jgi:YggT family protein
LQILVFLLDWISWIVFVVTLAVAGLLLLRVIFNWIGVNPFGRIPYHLTRLTEPMVRPMRSQFGGRALRYDMLPLVVAVMVLVVGLFVSSFFGQLRDIFFATGGIIQSGLFASRQMLGVLISLVGLLYVAAIFLRFFMPFMGVGYMNKWFRFIFVITEPLLKPLRRIFVAGMFDFSPLIAMLIVQVLTSVVANAVAR